MTAQTPGKSHLMARWVFSFLTSTPKNWCTFTKPSTIKTINILNFNFKKSHGPLQKHPTIKRASYLERLVADGENSQCTVVGHCEQPWEIFRWKCSNSIFLIFQVFRKSNQNLVSCKSTARIGPSWAPWQNYISKNFMQLVGSWSEMSRLMVMMVWREMVTGVAITWLMIIFLSIQHSN